MKPVSTVLNQTLDYNIAPLNVTVNGSIKIIPSCENDYGEQFSVFTKGTP
uniref:Uncharacterized protein n=1 Tax=Anguilla anguilla TaxID=7936 RepID=A0A0E9UEN8_ANGAN